MNAARLTGQQSVKRAIDVLFALEAMATSPSPPRASQVAAAVDLNRTTAWRYLQTLAETGLVREFGDGRFGLGGRTLSLAEAYTRQWGDLDAVASVALVRLRDTTGETAALHLRQGWSRVVVRQVESYHELHRTYRELGQPISLLTGAPSVAILAAIDEAERTAFLDAQGSPDGRRAIEQAVADTIAAGYAHSRGARVPGVASVAAAVRDERGQVVAAVNVTGPEDRLPESLAADLGAEVAAAAAWVEARLADRTGAPTPDPVPNKGATR